MHCELGSHGIITILANKCEQTSFSPCLFFFRPAALGNPPRGGCSVDATPTEIRSSPGPSSCGMPWVWGIKKIVIMICETL